MRYLDDQRAGLGAELLDEVERRLSDVRSKPAIATPVRDAPASLPAERVLLRRFRYALILLWAADALVVLAVSHHRRDPGYWHHRRDP